MNRRKTPIKRVFFIEEFSLIISFFLALLIRFRGRFYTWNDIYDGLYVSFLIVLILVQALIFLVYDYRRKSIFIQDPFENLMTVIKSHVILIVFALFYLYATQNGENSSRFVVAALFVLSIVIDFLGRLICRKLYISKNQIAYASKVLELWAPYKKADDVIAEFRNGGYDEVLIHQDETGTDILKSLAGSLESVGIRTYIDVQNMEYKVRSGILTDVAGYASVPAFVRFEKFNLFGIKYSIARTEEAVLHVMRHVKELSGEYICFSNVHTSVMARENADYRQILNESAFTFPDGNPIAVLQQKKGLIGAERVAGPDFMEHMFKDTQDGQISHYFYGASQETLDALKEGLLKKYPGINIMGMYSPPYRELTAEEDIADIERINSSGADIIWVGLGAPKQEKWMNAHKGRLNGVMLGVGAGFDFHAGTIKRAPKWIQKVGLEWLYRLFQDPERLFKRYFVTNVKFFWYMLTDRNRKQ